MPPLKATAIWWKFCFSKAYSWITCRKKTWIDLNLSFSRSSEYHRIGPHLCLLASTDLLILWKFSWDRVPVPTQQQVYVAYDYCCISLWVDCSDALQNRKFPLLCACRSRKVPVVAILLKYGADPNQTEIEVILLRSIKRSLESFRVGQLWCAHVEIFKQTSWSCWFRLDPSLTFRIMFGCCLSSWNQNIHLFTGWVSCTAYCCKTWEVSEFWSCESYCRDVGWAWCHCWRRRFICTLGKHFALNFQLLWRAGHLCCMPAKRRTLTVQRSFLPMEQVLIITTRSAAWMRVEVIIMINLQTGGCALHLATKYGDETLLTLLISQGAEINQGDDKVWDSSIPCETFSLPL